MSLSDKAPFVSSFLKISSEKQQEHSDFFSVVYKYHIALLRF